MDKTDRTIIGIIVVLGVIAVIVYFFPAATTNRYGYQTYNTYPPAAANTATVVRYNSTASSSSSNFVYTPGGYIVNGTFVPSNTINYVPQGTTYYYYTPGMQQGVGY